MFLTGHHLTLSPIIMMFVLIWVLPKKIAWEKNLGVGCLLEGDPGDRDEGTSSGSGRRGREKGQYKGVLSR